jgi:MvdD-like protein with pre-ATP grasp domain/ribosomal protein S6-L-glutamate ligase RimK-like protein
MPSTVLIITNEYDIHADAVVLELYKRDVPVFRFHPDDFPHACSVSIEVQDGSIEGEIVTPSRTVAFKDICAAWYRRPQSLFAGGGNLLSTELNNYVRAQSMLTLRTLCESLQTLWVCHPHKLQRADLKALQLAEASKAGLKTPNTLITNDPAKAAAFVDQLGGTECAIKPLIPLGVQNEEGYRLPLTTTLPKGHPLDSVGVAPTILQPYVDKEAELRCVVIGEKIFSARINSQANENTRKDWRGGEYQLEPFSLPEQVEASILRLMDSFGINFASLDMILTPEGEFVFLELNPNGQWLWLENKLGLPLVESMADLLTTSYARTDCEQIACFQ